MHTASGRLEGDGAATSVETALVADAMGGRESSKRFRCVCAAAVLVLHEGSGLHERRAHAAGKRAHGHDYSAGSGGSAQLTDNKQAPSRPSHPNKDRRESIEGVTKMVSNAVSNFNQMNLLVQILSTLHFALRSILLLMYFSSRSSN